MKKILPKIIIGLIITIAGLGVGFIYLAGANEGKNFLFLAISLALIAGGIFVLSRVGDAVYNLNTQTEDDNTTPANTSHAAGFQDMLQKNSQMVSEYEKVNKTKDQLKILEIAGAAEEQAGK